MYDNRFIRCRRLLPTKSHIEINQTEEKGDKNEEICKNKQIKAVKKCQVKLETLKTRPKPFSDSPSSPEKRTSDHVGVNSDSQKELFTPPNLTPPVSRLRRTRGFSRVQKAIKFSEE